METFVHIKSDKFPVLKGENEEIINPGRYGKALSIYLQEKLRKLDYDSLFYCPEDWGWWIEIKSSELNYGICIYSLSESELLKEYVVCPSIKGEKKWNWSKFRFINTEEITKTIVRDIVDIFKNDSEIEIIEVTNEFP